jgi:hypothetical protein
MQCRKDKPVYEFVTEEPEMMGERAVCSDCMWAISMGRPIDRASTIVDENRDLMVSARMDRSSPARGSIADQTTPRVSQGPTSPRWRRVIRRIFGI